MNTPFRILFIGDSITDCGRRDPATSPLGSGYVNWFSHLWTLRNPDKPLDIINRGIGGNTAEDLWSRWHDDVIVEEPEALVIKIGINDCNRFLCDTTGNSKQAPEAYAAYLDKCLDCSRQAFPKIPILLITPFFLSRDTDTDRYRGKVSTTLPRYVAAVHSAADKFGANHLDTEKVFAPLLDHLPPSALSNDMVHLNELGVLALAEGVHASVLKDIYPIY